MARKRPSLAIVEAASIVKREAGPQAKLNSIVLAALIQSLRLGAPYKLACEAAGISYSVFRSWMADAEKNPTTSPYRELPQLVRAARAWRANKALARIDRAAQAGEWKADEFLLKHSYQEHFQTAKSVEISGPEGGPVSIHVVEQAMNELKTKIGSLSDEQLDALEDDDESES